MEKLMNNKKINIFLSVLILVVFLIIGVFTSLKFIEFRDFETEFVITSNVDHIYKFHEFSKHLEGTRGDSDIYVINGSENTVCVVKKTDESKYNNISTVKSSKVGAVENSKQLEIASLLISGISTCSNLETLKNGLKNGTYDCIIVRNQDAKEMVKNDNSLVISSAEVEKVPSVLVIGGTHPNEPSGQLTATIFLENAKVERGTLYVITELNKSAYSYSQPQEATTWYYTLKTKNGTSRVFKFGSRASNTIDQWPTPDVYTHSSGQQLSSSEVRNINRAYPGNENGNFTEQIAYTITNFVNKKDVTMVIDLHEASPEYITINACVIHEDSQPIINKIKINKLLQYPMDGEVEDFSIKFEPSPPGMHGLTHREIGDFTNAYAYLLETSNAAQGKLRGAFTEDLITYYKKDKFYEAAVEYDEKNKTSIIYGRPVNIDERVARHTFMVSTLISGFNVNGCVTRSVNVSKIGTEGSGGEYVGEFIINNIPSYEDIYKNGVGYYLLDIKK